MSGLKNTAKRSFNASVGKGWKTNDEIRAEKKAKKQKAINKQFENANMPDEQMLNLIERRKAAKRVGSRASTVMTSGDTLG